MPTNKFPSYLTLVLPKRAQEHAAATPVSLRSRTERQPAAALNALGVVSRHDLLGQLDTLGELAPSAPLSFVVVKLFGLETLNREYGEARGDFAIRTAAETIARVSRATDMVGRLSGSGFGIILQGSGAVSAGRAGSRLQHHLDLALRPFPYVRAEVGTATGTGLNADMLPVAALAAFPVEFQA